MNDFKLIAIRPLESCNIKFLKNLKAGQIYKFYNDYSFFDNKEKEVVDIGEVYNVLYKSTAPQDLYQITTHDENIINVNISAIVGKNGSGKSNLLELLYLSCYVIAENKNILGVYKFLSKELKRGNEYFWQAEVLNLEEILNNFHFELYYSQNDSIYKLQYTSGIKSDNKESKLKLFRTGKSGFIEIKRFSLIRFFYSIVINYSLYGLNSNVSGSWLNSLFHKNDGYQTPIVINPFRKEGVIDINSEYQLAQSRLLLNLVENEFEELSYLIDNKIFIKIDFIIEPNEIESFREISTDLIFTKLEEVNRINVVDFFALMLQTLVGQSLAAKEIENLKIDLINESNIAGLDKYRYDPEESTIEYKKLLPIIVKYTVRKVLKICYQYDDYESFRDEAKTENKLNIPLIKNIDALIRKINNDKSHITLKLFQILTAFKESYFDKDWEVIRSINKINEKSYLLKLDKIEFISMIKKAKSNYKYKQIEELQRLIPNALFQPHIYVANIETQDDFYDFRTLSSGEQQLIHSIHSILYHIKNLNSVFSVIKSRRVTYKNINIILDEIELYYHPDYQKKFIYYLITELKRLRISSIKGINFLFSTHSPFILSDIPNSNILKLKEGKPDINNLTNETFGANIHDLLANDFFLQDGFMGEFVKHKITRTLNWLKIQGNKTKGSNYFEIDEEIKYNIQENDKIFHKAIIELIGEPIIKHQLKKMYFEFVDDNDYIDLEIEKINKMRK